jgi:hypothetical protein
VYDYVSFSKVCKACPLLEQISVAFPQVSVIRSQNEASENCSVREISTDCVRPALQSFVHFENCLGDLAYLVTLNITTWPNNMSSSSKLPRKIYEHLLADLAQQGFERSSDHAKEHGRSSRLAIVAFGASDKVYDREDSKTQIIFVKGRQIDPLGNEKSTAVQMGTCIICLKAPSTDFVALQVGVCGSSSTLVPRVMCWTSRCRAQFDRPRRAPPAPKIWIDRHERRGVRLETAFTPKVSGWWAGESALHFAVFCRSCV